MTAVTMTTTTTGTTAVKETMSVGTTTELSAINYLQQQQTTRTYVKHRRSHSTDDSTTTNCGCKSSVIGGRRLTSAPETTVTPTECMYVAIKKVQIDDDDASDLPTPLWSVQNLIS